MVSSQTVLALTVACALTFGVLVVLLSSMRGQLAANFRLDEQHLGSLWAVMNFVLVPLVFVAGVLIDLTDIRWVVVVGSMLTALSLLMLQGGSYRQAMMAAFLASAGGACIACAAMVLMPRAFFGSHEASASLNMGNVFFALGALIAPALADVLLRGVGLRWTLGLLAAGCLIPGVLAVLVNNQDVPPPQETDLLAILFDPVVWIAGAVFFLYAPVEGCFHNWAGNYLSGVGHRERDLPRLVAGFWTFFLVGRLAMAFMQHRRWFPDEAERWMVFFMALGATVCLGNLVGTVSKKSATTTLFLMALFLGPIFPTLIGFLFMRYSSGLGTVFGVVFAIGSAGSLFFAPLISSRMNRNSAQAALRIPLTLSVLLMALTLIFALWTVDSHQ